MKEILCVAGGFVAFVSLIVWLGVRSENSKAEGCRDAGGSMIGEICIIRNDRSCPE